LLIGHFLINDIGSSRPTVVTPRQIVNYLAQAYAFSEGALNRGHWVEFMIDVVWSTTGD
jgi:hypothetical protein